MSDHSHGGHSGGGSHGGHAHGGHSHGHGVPVERGFVAAERPAGSVVRHLERGAGQGKVLYFDCSSGIAGDMTIACLLDLGVPSSVVEQAVIGLGLRGVTAEAKTGYAGAIGCLHFDVHVEGDQPERSYRDIVRLLDSADLSAKTRQLAHDIFERLARAEAEVHRTTLDHVHFHEVGAVDALVDIVGAAACFDYLEARVLSSPVPLGRGFVECRHGILPLPAPAALLCLQGVPTVASGLEAELVTPTGAAILATVAEGYADWCSMKPEVVGWGAGTRGLPDRPNVLRAVLGSAQPPEASGLTLALLEANVDDMTGELVAHVIECALKGGALDAWATPATMKKGRPGIVLSVLVSKTRAKDMSSLLLRETTSIGVRQTLVSRQELERRIENLETRFGNVRVKLSGDPLVTLKPELDDCRAIAHEQGIPLRDVLGEVEALARQKWSHGRTND